MKIILALFKRSVLLIPLAFLITSATFLLASLIPGDFFTALEANPTVRPETVAQLRQQYGMDQPAYLQYVRWLWRSLQLDLGYSLFYGRSVTSVVAGALANTLWIGVPALLIGLLAGIILGTFHALHHQRPVGHALDFLSTTMLSLPSLILGLAALLLASQTNWFPLGGMSSSSLTEPDSLQRILDRLHHLALPVACLALPLIAVVERVQYAASRNIKGELFVRSALARGLGGVQVFLHYLVRPSLNTIVSTLGPMFGAVLSGSLVLEWIFSWPGLGKVTYDALFNRDIFLLLGCVSCASILLVLGNLAADVLLFVLDPRTQESAGGVAP